MRWVIVLVLLVLPSIASADDVAPELETADLRTRARTELRALLSDADRKRFPGMYVAVDRDASELVGQVACDDDGDFVILLSDAMLRLAAHLAWASLYEGTAIDDYASFLAQAQVPGKRLLPPPAGFHRAPIPAGYDERLGEVISFLLARELVRFRAGELVCAHPTVTVESGDDTWTDAERRVARVVASTIYPRHAAERDTEARARLAEIGRGDVGAQAVTKLFVRFRPTYGVQHP